MSSETAEEPRARIFHVAQNAFGERDYGSVSVREIAAAAGVTVPMIYYYYGSKEGLFRALIEQGRAEMEELLEPIRQDGGPVEQRLNAVMWSLFCFCRRDTGLVRLVHRLLAGGDRVAPAVDAEKIHRQAQMVVEEVVKTGQERGELRAGDPRELSLFIFGVCGEYARSSLAGRVELSEDLARRLVRWLLAGMHADP